MALRNITVRGESILAKKCKPVREITPRIREACADMVDTMKAADGVGIAAPQIGIMKRFFIAMPHVDAEDEATRDKIYYMINPEITYTEGTQDSSEGCLSVPGYMGLVERPYKIRIKATDLDGKEHEYEFEGFEATVFCHEYDHLEGILYSDIARDMMTVEEYSELLEKVKEMHSEDEEADNSEIWALRNKERV
ncbi:MAG: peptide deformylase [Mogibacterium sp.]|nr:peptide deformylase [Mogibacterium sp.]MCQ2562883.1 peptide deformylase [Mogibacterium sp.]